ncbi:unnamed protein product [Caenorhabditis auriculariae]|uniref:Uncharacterized protein n=1 Tax=Caenorhabditis auriculariae TaxID=2777116 RepID=A0A8S1GWU4_9PELO|nr:unnamed protein product [Caenorhabditis auriculariae]
MSRLPWLLLLLLPPPTSTTAKDPRDTCPLLCDCDHDQKLVRCEGVQVISLPDRVPSTYETLLIRNTSIRSVAKNSFRKMERLVNVEFDHNPHLSTLEKLAFRGMKKIRLIKFASSPQLTEIERGAFTGISNQFGLKILFEDTPIRRIHGGAFRNAHSIRELSISGVDLALSRHSFASIRQLDFLTVSGVVLAEPELFSNSTRFHIVHIRHSEFDLPPRVFHDLSHVHHILIERSRLASIAPDAFSGLTTIEVIELSGNNIGSISARAFTGVENLGQLKITRNTIQELDTSESVLSTAWQTRVEENTLNCTCDLKWMTALSETSDVNFCGASGAYRSVRSFALATCAMPSRQKQSVAVPVIAVTSLSSSLFLSFSAALLSCFCFSSHGFCLISQC